jgi:hypothetical protein
VPAARGDDEANRSDHAIDYSNGGYRGCFWGLSGKQRCVHHAEAPVLETSPPSAADRWRSGRAPMGMCAATGCPGDGAGGMVPAAAEPGLSSICVVAEP